MELEKQTEKTIDFLKRFGHLDSDQPAEFRGQDRPGQLLTMLGCRPPYCFDPMHYQQPVSGEVVYRNNYQTVQEGLGSIGYVEFFKLPLKEIPNSEEAVLIDVGSDLGRQKTRPIAKAKPKLRVYMIDKMTKIDNLSNILKFEYTCFGNDDFSGEAFKNQVPASNDFESTINNILQANGYKNIIFIHREMQYLGPGKTNLGDLKKVTSSRRVFFTGYFNPAGLGNTTIFEAAYHKAEKIYLNNSALEKIEPNSERFNLMKEFLSDKLTPQEIKKLNTLLYNPKTIEISRFSYDFNVESERQFGIALKQLFVLAQADWLQKNGFDAEIFLMDWRNNNGSEFGHTYNSPDHNLIAQRRKKKPSRS